MKLTPDDLMTNRNLGLVLLLAKKYSEAEQVLARSLKKVPNDMVAQSHAGARVAGQHKTTAAQATYEKAAQMALRTRGPDLAAVYAELGPMYVENGKLDQAVTRARDGGQGGGADAGREWWRSATWRSRISSAALERLRDPKQSDARARGHGAGGQGAAAAR